MRAILTTNYTQLYVRMQDFFIAKFQISLKSSERTLVALQCNAGNFSELWPFFNIAASRRLEIVLAGKVIKDGVYSNPHYVARNITDQ